MPLYNHKKIEARWQKEWSRKKLYRTKDTVRGKKNFYALVEFPYPSGNLHTGHWYAFSVPDIFVRAKRMQGYNVMFPIGFDAFGLPAENAAIKRGLNPRKWTLQNIAYMKKQIQSMGASFDWSREVITCTPEYYKWTQWLFLQMYKKGLAYQAETPVNWCPKDKTVLANEQVVGGKCERCGADIIQKKMTQWMLRITQYADRLLDGLDGLDWRSDIKDAQRNWIGKSEGALLHFSLKDSAYAVDVFTTRPDTLYGATYLVLAPEHSLISALKEKIENWAEVEAYIKKARSKTDLERQQGEKDKTGVELVGVKAVNPANKKEISIWISDYVLGSYGTGAIMAVPAHDERDFAFAKKFHLPIEQVVVFKKEEAFLDADQVYTGQGLLINSGRFNSMQSEDAKKSITEFVGGTLTSQYKLRDWVLSRQRYWGCPIPVVHCASCGIVPIPEKNLPVVLPEIKDYLPQEDGKSPLAKANKWVKVTCPTCKKPAERETDTMDTFVDSSWYFLRYTDPKNKKKFADTLKMKQWMPVDLYSGGAEHTTMHLLYSRFFMKVLKDLKLVSWDEPYMARRNRGIILGPDGQKMSKSKGNVVDPDEYVKKLGSDTVRMYLAFIGPFNEVGSYPWDPQSILGIRRFLDRVYTFYKNTSIKALPKKSKQISPLDRTIHKATKKITDDIADMHFNTAISQLMVTLTAMEGAREQLSRDTVERYALLLAPFAPHLAEEVWFLMRQKGSIHQQPWPQFDPKLLEDATFQLIVQINGKMRDKFEVPIATTEKEALQTALAREAVIRSLNGASPKKVIFVPKRLLNIVI